MFPVSAVYVGVGSVKQVWPAWENGDGVVGTSDYWYYYRNDGASGNSFSGWYQYGSTYSFGSSYIRCRWTYPRPSGSGAFIASTKTIEAATIQYLLIPYKAEITCTSSSGFYLYVSVASSYSSTISSDSGVGSFGEVTFYSASSFSNEPTQYLRVNMTGCTRSGYLKIGSVRGSSTGSGSYSSDDSVSIFIYMPQVYNVQPTSSNSDYNSTYGHDCTVT